MAEEIKEIKEEKPKSAISIVDLHKAYGKKKVLKGLSLEVYPGELFGFIGRNGIGKSTTIDCMIGSKRFQKVRQTSTFLRCLSRSNGLYGKPLYCK